MPVTGAASIQPRPSFLPRALPATAITLSAETISRLTSSQPAWSLEQLGNPDAARHAGRSIELLTGGGEILARGIADPENGVLRVLTRDEAELLDETLLRRRVQRALNLRRRLGLLSPERPVDSAFRLIFGEGEGLSGFLIEAYGPFLVQYVYSRGLKSWGQRLAAVLATEAREMGLVDENGAPWPRGILQKVRSKDAARPGKPDQSVVHGEEPPKRYVVLENGVPFEIHPRSGLNVGLFTDLREHRWRLGRYCREASVLNTFAYTGSLSVAAALGGASRVTSVDLSSGVLKWARQNFVHAGLDPDQHDFEVSDVGRYLKRCRSEGRRFDVVVVDPPTYSAARAASWSMKRDLPELVRSALDILHQGGVLWLSANAHAIGSEEIDAQIRRGAELAGREVRRLESGGLGADSPVPISCPGLDYLKLRVLQV